MNHASTGVVLRCHAHLLYSRERERTAMALVTLSAGLACREAPFGST